MSVVLEIQKQLEVTKQRVVSLEQAASQHPGSPSIAANLDSAVRIQKKLEGRFVWAAWSIAEKTDAPAGESA